MYKKNIRDIFSLVVLFLFFTQCGFSQAIDIPVPGGFKKEINYPVYTADDLWDYINGGADSYTALGFVDLNIIEFTKGKKNSVKLEVYRHKNVDMAFGIYALERVPSYNFIDIGVQGYEGEGFLNFFKGQYYIKVYTHSKSKKALEAVKFIALEMDLAIDSGSDFPSQLADFPDDGKKYNEEMFISENVIGHSFLSDAFRANYEVDNKSFVLYLFSREEAGDIQDLAQLYLLRQDLDTDNQSKGKSSFKDGYNGDIFMAWEGNLMVLITGLKAEDSELADMYISKIID